MSIEPKKAPNQNQQKMSKGRIYIKEVQQDIQFRARCTVIRWCHKNNVRIYIDRGSKQEFVLRVEFEKAKRADPRRKEYVFPWDAVKISDVMFIETDANGTFIYGRPPKGTSLS